MNHPRHNHMDRTDATSIKEGDCREWRTGEWFYRKYLSPRETEPMLNEALNAYARVLENQPDSTSALAGMASAFLKLGEYAKAARFAQKCLDSPEPDAKARYEAAYVLGFTAFRRGDIRSAMQACQRAIRFGGLRGARAHWLLSRLYREQSAGHPVRSLSSIPQSLLHGFAGLLLSGFDRERMPLSIGLLLLPRLLLARMLETLDMDAGALAQCMDIHARFPGLAAISVMIGNLHRKDGQWEEARFWFEKTIRRYPGLPEGYYHLARLLEEQEDYEAMADTYARLLTLKPGDAYLHCHLANARFYLQDFAGALTHYESALHLGTDSKWKAMIAQSIANIHSDFLQNPDAAIGYYRMARALDADDPENDTRIGLLYFQKGDYHNAELVYRQALAEAPRNARLHSNLGYLRWMAEDPDEAIACYEQAMRLDPEYEIPVNNIGVIYLDMLGNVPKAIELFERAIALDPDYALAHYNLGRAHSFLGNRLEAVHCFQVAQEANLRSQELDQDDLSARIHQLFDLRGLQP